MKKKLTIGILLVGLVAAIGFSGTLAWFTDKEEASNTLQTGFIDIALTEPNYQEENYQALQPGDTILKDPTITIEDSSEDAYIRLKVTNATVNRPGKEPISITLEDLQAKNTEDWTLSEDGYYYYKNIVTKGDTIAFLQNIDNTTMTIPTSWDNSYANASITLTFTVDAIQANNNEANVNDLGIWANEIAGTNIVKYEKTTSIG